MSTPTIAAFDLDGTLTKGGSVFHWLRFVCGNGAVARVAVPLSPALTVGAIRSGHYADEAKERLFRGLLEGRSFEEVAEQSRHFILEHLAHEARLDVIARLRWHRERGDDVVLVSASPQLYVDVLVEHFGITGGLGTRLAVDESGRLTGRYQGNNCRGTEKMRRLREWIDARGYEEEPLIYAYGNSRGDRRLLGGANLPYDVGRLGRLGALRNFPRLGPDSP
ncbi:MAG: HAD-IB family hydrolase [Acidimicrobiaceae bacterium]|nr:HAD-IB family hydrolase [Acidimicrobiaceae bacterium]